MQEAYILKAEQPLKDKSINPIKSNGKIGMFLFWRLLAPFTLCHHLRVDEIIKTATYSAGPSERFPMQAYEKWV